MGATKPRTPPHHNWQPGTHLIIAAHLAVREPADPKAIAVEVAVTCGTGVGCGLRGGPQFSLGTVQPSALAPRKTHAQPTKMEWQAAVITALPGLVALLHMQDQGRCDQGCRCFGCCTRPGALLPHLDDRSAGPENTVGNQDLWPNVGHQPAHPAAVAPSLQGGWMAARPLQLCRLLPCRFGRPPLRLPQLLKSAGAAFS